MQICGVNCQFYLLILVTTFVLIFFCFLGQLQELSALSVLFHRFMQTLSSDENSVRPSVCLSVKRVHCDKTEERSVQIF